MLHNTHNLNTKLDYALILMGKGRHQIPPVQFKVNALTLHAFYGHFKNTLASLILRSKTGHFFAASVYAYDLMLLLIDVNNFSITK